MRRFVGVGAVVALALGGAFAATSVGAAQTPFDAVGAVHCNLNGRYKMHPGLANALRANVTQTFRARLTCTTGTTGGAGIVVTGGHIAGTGNPSTASCATTAVPFVRATISWKTKGGKINPTVIKWASGTTVTSPRVIKTFGGAQATVTGSYAGSAARARIISDVVGQAACATKNGMKLFKLTGAGGASTVDLPSTGATSTTTTTVTTPPVGGTLLFSDEFNGSALDTTKWVALNRIGDQSNNEAQCYRPANVAVGGGVVSMTSKADTSCAGHSYTSGNIQWKSFNYTYGTIDIRAKLAGGTGTWPADWMIGHNCQVSNVTSADNIGTCSWPNPGSEEIDIAEMWNDSKTTVHQNFLSSAPSFTCASSGLSDVSQNWHVYTLVWSPGHLTWKVDGVQKCVASVAPSSAMFLTLNTAMGGAHGGTIVASTLPQVHSIDYVRVYR